MCLDATHVLVANGLETAIHKKFLIKNAHRIRRIVEQNWTQWLCVVIVSIQLCYVQTRYIHDHDDHHDDIHKCVDYMLCTDQKSSIDDAAKIKHIKRQTASVSSHARISVQPSTTSRKPQRSQYLFHRSIHISIHVHTYWLADYHPWVFRFIRLSNWSRFHTSADKCKVITVRSSRKEHVNSL